MKLALRYIPTEVWVDVICYPWISRKQLGKIVHKFRNRYFAEILQYCLHDKGKRMLAGVHLGELYILPQTPMPDNIKFFQKIAICRFDSHTLEFLHRIRSLFLFNEVNLILDFGLKHDLAKLRTILAHLSPILHGIHSMEFTQSAIPLVEEHFGPKLAQIKLLSIDLEFNGATPIQMASNFCLNWLTSGERDSTEPRYLHIYSYLNNFQQFFLAVQQQFLSAKSPATFAILLKPWDGNPPIDNFRLENSLGEQLHGQSTGFWKFQINRHRPNAGTALQEWVEQTVVKRQSNSIEIGRHVAIGQIDANAGANEMNGGVEDADQQSTSG